MLLLLYCYLPRIPHLRSLSCRLLKPAFTPHPISHAPPPPLSISATPPQSSSSPPSPSTCKLYLPCNATPLQNPLLRNIMLRQSTLAASRSHGGARVYYSGRGGGIAGSEPRPGRCGGAGNTSCGGDGGRDGIGMRRPQTFWRLRGGGSRHGGTGEAGVGCALTRAEEGAEDAVLVRGGRCVALSGACSVGT